MTARRWWDYISLLSGALFTSAALTLHFLSAGWPWLGALSVALGAGWFTGWHRRIALAVNAGLTGVVGLAALALLLGMPAALALTVLVAGLLAWDLMRFDHLLRAAKRIDDGAGLEHAHLRRVLLTCAAGWGLAALAMAVRLDAGFNMIALLTVLAVLALGRAVRAIQQAR